MAVYSRPSARGAELAAGLDIPPDLRFAAVRRRVRERIAEGGAGRDVEELVEELLG